MKILHKIVSAAFAAIISFSCADSIVSECDTDTENQPTVSVNFSDIQSQVFTPKCAIPGCHAGTNPEQNMNLSAGSAWNALVNIASNEVSSLKRVDPGNGEDSYLIIKLRELDNRRVGERMPKGGPYLSLATIDSIKAWIDKGALDN